MCGLFGSFGISLSPRTIEVGLSSINHRGPDDSFFLSDDKTYTCAAVRLAFQDIKNGRQPFNGGKNNSYIVSLNGEIYNYSDLKVDIDNFRKSLLKTNCDTELLIPLYEIHGIKMINLIRGMYGIAIWDKKEKKGFLSVDFLSQKPLFYSLFNGNLYYSSDLTSLKEVLKMEGILKHNDYDYDYKDVNENGLLDIIKFKSILNGETIYNDITKLKPGMTLEFNLSCPPDTRVSLSNTQSLNTILTPKNFARNIISENNVVHEVDYLLRKAIEKRVDKSVDQSLYLSGGLDSSLVAAMLRDIYPNIKINTFNLCYEGINMQGKNLDEEYADLMSTRLESVHHKVKVNPEKLSSFLPAIVKSFGEPFAAVPSMWFVAKRIKEYSKYSISGDGADELFGSYYTHRESAKIQSISHDPSELLSKYLNSFLPSSINLLPFINRLNKLRDLSFYHPANKQGKTNDALNTQLIFEAMFTFPYGVLTYVDRLSMAHSVEPRSPFLDQELWSYVNSLPSNLKINKSETKYILKKVAEKYLPKSVIYRKKEGFVFPLFAYLLKDRKRITSNILNMIEYYEIFKEINFSSNSLEIMFDDINLRKDKAFKSAQFVHALNTICVWNSNP